MGKWPRTKAPMRNYPRKCRVFLLGPVCSGVGSRISPHQKDPPIVALHQVAPPRLWPPSNIFARRQSCVELALGATGKVSARLRVERRDQRKALSGVRISTTTSPQTSLGWRTHRPRTEETRDTAALGDGGHHIAEGRAKPDIRSNDVELITIALARVKRPFHAPMRTQPGGSNERIHQGAK
jgi:hypothetical protein